MAWRFSKVVRGYDPAEVDRYIEDLERHNNDLLSEVEQIKKSGPAPVQVQPAAQGGASPAQLEEAVGQLQFQLGQLGKYLADMDAKRVEQERSIDMLSSISSSIREEQRGFLGGIESSQEQIVNTLGQLSEKLLGETSNLQAMLGSSIDDNFSGLREPVAALSARLGAMSDELAEKIAGKAASQVAEVQREFAIGLTATEEKLRATQDHLVHISEELNSRQAALAGDMKLVSDQMDIKLGTNQTQLLLTMSQATEEISEMEKRLNASLDKVEKIEGLYDKMESLLADIESRLGDRTESIFAELLEQARQVVSETEDKISGRLKDIKAEMSQELTDGMSDIRVAGSSMNDILETQVEDNARRLQAVVAELTAIRQEAVDRITEERTALSAAVQGISEKMDSLDPGRFMTAFSEAQEKMESGLAASTERLSGQMAERQAESARHLESVQAGFARLQEDIGGAFDGVLAKMSRVTEEGLAARVSSSVAEKQQEIGASLAGIRSEMESLRNGLGSLAMLGELMDEADSARANDKADIALRFDALTESIQEAKGSFAAAGRDVSRAAGRLEGMTDELSSKFEEALMKPMLERINDALGGLQRAVDSSTETLKADLATRDETLFGGVRETLDGTLGEMGLLRQSLRSGLEEVSAAVADTTRLEALAGKSEDNLNESRELIAGAMATMEDRFAAAVDSIKQELPGRVISDLSASYDELVSQVNVTFRQSFGKIKGEFQEVLEDMNARLAGRVEESVDGRVEPAVGRMNELVDRLTGDIDARMREISSSIDGKVDEFRIAVDGMKEDYSARAAELAGRLGSMGDSWGEEMRGQIEALQASVASRMDEISERNAADTQEGAERLRAMTNDEFGRMRNMLDEDLDKVRADVASAIKELETSLSEKESQFLGSISYDMESKMDAMRSSVEEKFDSLAGSSKETLEGLATGITASNELSIAEITTIREELESMRDRLTATMAEMADKADNAQAALSASVNSNIANEHVAIKEGMAGTVGEAVKLLKEEIAGLQSGIQAAIISVEEMRSGEADNLAALAARLDEMSRLIPDGEEISYRVKEAVESSSAAVTAGVGQALGTELGRSTAEVKEAVQTSAAALADDINRLADAEKMEELAGRIPQAGEIADKVIETVDGKLSEGNATISRAIGEISEKVDSQLGDIRNEFSGIAFRNAQDIGQSLEAAAQRLEEIPDKTISRLREELDLAAEGMNKAIAGNFEEIAVSQADVANKVQETMKSLTRDMQELTTRLIDEQADLNEKLVADSSAMVENVEQVSTKIDFSRERTLTAMRQVTEDIEEIRKSLVERIVEETTTTLKAAYSDVLESISRSAEEKLSHMQDKILVVLAEATEQLNQIPANMAVSIGEKTAERMDELQGEINRVMDESVARIEGITEEIERKLVKGSGVDKEEELYGRISEMTAAEMEEMRKEFLVRLNHAAEGLQAPVNAVLHLLMSRQ